MRQTHLIMGMPVTVEIVAQDTGFVIDKVFDYFIYIDNKFSVYKKDSEVMQINRGEILVENSSLDMQEIFGLADQTKQETDGYFDIVNQFGIYDPSGIVKGWAIYEASKIIEQAGFDNYYVDAGGDIQVCGKNSEGKQWKIGIKNPFNKEEIVKTVYLDNGEIATSGTYIRGQHIYNPRDKSEQITEIVSPSVIGPNVYEADRFATAAFAMGKAGIHLIERIKGLEGYIIDSAGIATMTSGFEKYINN